MVIRKPDLALVGPTPTGSAPPSTLRVHGLTLWESVMSEYRIDDIGGLSILAQICAAADRAEELAAQIAIDGPAIMTKSGLREHPLLKHEFGCRSFVTRKLQRLGLNVEALKPIGRPPGRSPHQLPLARLTPRLSAAQGRGSRL
jgi:hypothetical protein